jgi:hypothetical protein
MQAGLLWAASATLLATFAVHTFIGGVYVARPLLADQVLPKAAKWLAYFCWHIVTMLLFAMAVVFGLAAASCITRNVAFGLSLFCTACSVLSITVALKAGIAPWRFPSTSLFALAAMFGFAATFS